MLSGLARAPAPLERVLEAGAVLRDGPAQLAQHAAERLRVAASSHLPSLPHQRLRCVLNRSLELGLGGQLRREPVDRRTVRRHFAAAMRRDSGCCAAGSR